MPLVQESLVLGGDRGSDEHHAGLCQQLIEIAGKTARLLDGAGGKPGIRHTDHAAERLQQSADGAAEAAETNNPHVAAAKEEGILAAAHAVLLRSGLERVVRVGDPARKIDAEAQSHFRDGLGEDRAHVQDMDPPPEAFLVVDVGQEVSFDIENRAEVRRSRQPFLRHIGLADHEGGLLKDLVDLGGRRLAGLAGEQLHDAPNSSNSCGRKITSRERGWGSTRAIGRFAAIGNLLGLKPAGHRVAHGNGEIQHSSVCSARVAEYMVGQGNADGDPRSAPDSHDTAENEIGHEVEDVVDDEDDGLAAFELGVQAVGHDKGQPDDEASQRTGTEVSRLDAEDGDLQPVGIQEGGDCSPPMTRGMAFLSASVICLLFGSIPVPICQGLEPWNRSS